MLKGGSRTRIGLSDLIRQRDGRGTYRRSARTVAALRRSGWLLPECLEQFVNGHAGQNRALDMHLPLLRVAFSNLDFGGRRYRRVAPCTCRWSLPAHTGYWTK